MKTKLPASNTKALTLIEVIVVIAVLGVLISMIIPSMHHSHTPAYRIKCVSNLKQIGLAFRLFASDHEGKFPMQVSTNDGGSLEFTGTGLVFEHFRALSNELTVPKIIICPSDDEQRITAEDFGDSLFANKNTSYFLGLEAEETAPNSILGGDRNLIVNGRYHHGIFPITTNTQAGWTTDSTHMGHGNVVFGDGSVGQFTTPDFQKHINEMGDATNRFSIPD